jgi:two-component system chemotaxis sensor kinase CheA
VTGGQFFDEFIDDYFSECDEHLATVRRVLLALEEQGTVAGAEGQLQELSRALHTLKGLSGMVSLAAAEEVAHAMEDAARALPTDGGIPPELMECLFVGETLLERCVAARRIRSVPPSPGPFVDRVRDVILAVTADSRQVAAAADSSSVGLQTIVGTEHRFEFAPSAALASRGVGVEMIRQRLATLGNITGTVPRVRPEGGVLFEFVVAVRADALPVDDWRADGLSWESWTAKSENDATGVVVHATRPSAGPVPSTSSNVVRVDLARLDDLMRQVGELVVTRARLSGFVERAAQGMSSAGWDDLNDANELIERQLRNIRESVMRIRLVQIGEVFERMRFAMRDIARETGKAIHLEFSGQETELDKLVVDRMLEPLLHLVRNSASHGIESRAERLNAGKPAEGTISLRAQAAGDRIVLEVEDDGAGIDVERVGRRARELGLVSGTAPLAPDALLDVICAPGFSTRDSADMTSGRGVGMAVARTTIRGLGGDLFVDSVFGHGTRFTIELPLTLMITDALIVEVGDQAMAIPQVALREILPLDPSAVTRFERNEVFSYRGRVVPLVNLGELFNFTRSGASSRHVLIVGSDLHLAGLVVDRLVGLREIVVHSVDDPFVAVPGIAGATELADGRVSLILDASALVRGTRSDRRASLSAAHQAALTRADTQTTTHAIPEHTWQ